MFGRRNSFDDGFSLEQWLTAPFRWLRRQWRKFGGDDSISERESNWLVDWLTLPFRLLGGLAVFLVSGWAGSRSQWAFVLGIPAFLGLLTAMLGALAFTYLNQRNYFRYHGNGVALLQEKEYDTALGFLRKACTLRFPEGFEGVPPDEKDWIVDIGDAVYQRDGLDRALEWMELVSPVGGVGNFRGHLWVASHLLLLPEGPTPEQLATVKLHLDAAFRQTNSYRDKLTLEYDLNVALVAYHRKISEPAESLPYLKRLAEIAPYLLPDYLRVLKDLNRTAEFQAAHRDGITRLTELAAEYPNDVRLWVAMAVAAILNESHLQGFQTLQNGIQQMTDGTSRNQLVGFTSNYLVEWYDSAFTRDDESKFKQGIVLLSQALRMNPGNGAALYKALDLLRDGQLAGQQLEWVVDSIDLPGSAPAVIQLLLGANALWHDPENGVEKARSYWSIAEALEPMATSQVLCNLALALDHKDATQLRQANDLLDVAISNSPSRANYRFTKAMVLVNTQQCSEARLILEELLQAGSDPRVILPLLVDCAKALDDGAAVAKYEQMLQGL